MAELNSHVIVSLDLTTPTNIALLKQLTETLSAVNEISLSNANRFLNGDPYVVTQMKILEAIQFVISLPQVDTGGPYIGSNDEQEAT